MLQHPPALSLSRLPPLPPLPLSLHPLRVLLRLLLPFLVLLLLPPPPPLRLRPTYK